MKQLKDKQTIFNKHSEYNAKCKLNRSGKNVPSHILEQIESGVTLEQLEQIQNSYPVFKYQTQITIHGQFENLNNNYIYGYKNIFQNKNKSIGIKYNAIDEEKRQRIYKKLRFAKFNYNRNSINTKFTITKTASNKIEFETKLNELKEIANKIDTSLIYGGKSLYYGNYMGIIYIILDLSINAIYEYNISKFVNNIITDAQIKEIELKEAEAEKQRESQWNKEAEAQEQKRKAIKETNKDYIFIHKNLELYKGEAKPGKYIKVYFDWNDNLKFKAIHVYKKERQKVCRANNQEFDTYQECIEYLKEPKEGWNDNKLNRITAYTI